MTNAITAQIRQILNMKRVSSKMSLYQVAEGVLVGIRENRYEGSYPADLQAAAYGVLHGIQTGRVDSSIVGELDKKTGSAAIAYLVQLVEMRLSGDDVSRFLNGRKFRWNGFRWSPVY